MLIATPHADDLVSCTYQHWIISSYIALGQPGGGGSRYPVMISSAHYVQATITHTQNYTNKLEIWNVVEQYSFMHYMIIS